MLRSLKTSLLLLWRGEKIWAIVSLTIIPMIFIILWVGEKTFPTYVLALLSLLWGIDYTFVVTSQSLDATELLVFPISNRQKFNFLISQSALGIKLIVAFIFIAFIFIVYPANTNFLMAIQLLLCYCLYCMFFTNFLLQVKRNKVYSFLMKHVLFIFLYFPLLMSGIEGFKQKYQILQKIYETHIFFITILLLAAMPVFYYLNLKWFMYILHKKPFYDLNVILRYNRKKIGF